jgi:hypothetical protein
MDRISVFWFSMVVIIFYYRNHEIKNVISKAFRVFEDSKTYLQNGVDSGLIIIKTYTNGIFSMIKQCQEFNKSFSELI